MAQQDGQFNFNKHELAMLQMDGNPTVLRLLEDMELLLEDKRVLENFAAELEDELGDERDRLAEALITIQDLEAEIDVLITNSEDA